MNTISFTTEKQEQYKQSKQKLLDFLSTLDEPLTHAATLLDMPRQDSVATITDKLHKDIFSLVLIGAFQSGKSTLFNYLCDGRELSPVGPGGGGIRTSGCRVTAHCVAEGEEEYAMISWRTPDELLRSLGKSLLPYYGEERGKSGADYLTEKLVNLHDESQRHLLEQRAWEQLDNPEHSAEDKELLRFTLLVCRFFPQFAERAQCGETRVSVQEVTKLTAYPQNWKTLWIQAKDSKDLSAFEGMVNFAFVAGVDLYLDSPILRELGCSVTDCPGLFISKWDTMIAERCIREANALLYMFGGEKALTQEDKKALQTCVELGGQYKMLFGANLRIAEQQWQRIEVDDVQPDLKELGFNAPVIHPFHSGLALRARERFLQEYKLLDSASQQGIDLDISLDRKFTTSGDADTDRTKYLEKVLNRFIFNLTNGDESLADYSVQNAQALEALSHVPDFIKSAKDFVVEHRAPSLLLHQGIDVILNELNNTKSVIQTKKEWLSSDTATAKQKAEELASELEKLECYKKQAAENIANCIKQVEADGIVEHFCRIMDRIVDEQKEEIKELFIKNKPGTYERILGNYDQAALCQNFADGLQKIFEVGLREVRKVIRNEFNSLPAFVQISNTFETERKRLMDEIRGLRELPSLHVMKVALPKNWEKAAAELAVPEPDVIWEVLTKNTSWTNVFWDLLTFGFWRLWDDDDAYAEGFYHEHKGAFKSCFRGALWKAMYEPGAPMGVIWGTLDDFEQAFEQPLQQARRYKEDAFKSLEEKDTKERSALISDLEAGAANYTSIINQAEGIKKDISAKL